MLDEDEIARLIDACDPDFQLLVRASFFTGARYGEVASLQAGDYLPDQRSIRIRQTKTKKTLTQPLNAAGSYSLRALPLVSPVRSCYLLIVTVVRGRNHSKHVQ
jgi:integrase